MVLIVVLSVSTRVFVYYQRASFGRTIVYMIESVISLYNDLLQDFMSGKIVFRNIMGILLPGVNTIITERTSQTYGQLLEKAVQLSLEIIILVLEKDLILSDLWRPLYQVIFSKLPYRWLDFFLMSFTHYKFCRIDLTDLLKIYIYFF